MAIRRYCEEHGYHFNLHANENITNNSFLVLERLIADPQDYNGIAMCSTGMLPQNYLRRSSILEQSLEAGLSLHFVFEQLIVSSVAEARAISDLVLLGSIADRSRELLKNLRGITSTS